MSTQFNTNDVSSNNSLIDDKSGKISRRDLLKYSAGAVGAASLSSVVAACGGAGFGGAGFGGGSSSSGGTVTINFWDMLWGNNSYFDVAKKLVNDFNNTHKGIKVVYRGLAWTNWYQTFTTAIGSGTQPDISTGASFMGVQFAGYKDILPLDDLVTQVKQNGQYNDFLPNVFAPMQYSGHTIGWPWNIDIRIPFYRTDLFQQASVQVPTTWDEWRTAARKLSTNGKYGLVQSAADNLTEHMLEMLMINNGGGLFTPGRTLDLATNPLNIQALQFFANLANDGSIDPASISYQSTDALSAFSRGDAAMTINSPGSTASMAPSILKDVSVLPPVKSPNGTTGTLYWVNNIIVYAATKHPNESKEFLLWWSQNNKPLWTQGGCGPLPIRSSFYQDSLFNTPIINTIKTQYVPIAKSANAQSTEVFPALNPLDGDGTMITLGQNLMAKKNFTTSVQTAQAGLQKVLTANPG